MLKVYQISSPASRLVAASNPEQVVKFCESQGWSINICEVSVAPTLEAGVDIILPDLEG